MPTYQYGEMFKKLGVPDMGRQGSGWCGFDPSGVLVLMAHQNFFHRNEKGDWYYEGIGDPRLPQTSVSAARSIRMMAEYFQVGREILLPVGVFKTDGQVHPDGRHEAAVFQYATGSVYRGTMRSFDPKTGTILCDLVSKFTV